ncbi:hypothetical protein AX15_005414 [Amanita polypyramis BW_CC]|nr:hypothetical protein AX15_005414 [Amanita polypyramis BW_CC]
MSAELSAVSKTLISLLHDDDPKTWEIPWKLGVTPWNKGTYHPTLREAIEEPGIDFPKGSNKRALVPGCGEGHDVIYLASTLGIHTTGLDISPTALERANNLVESNSNVPEDLISYSLDDFFGLKPQSETEKYDLIHDYTFFVAINPSRRLEWGRQMATLIKPGGYLITIVFPIDPKRDVGPPWYVRPDHYDQPLAGHFKKVVDKVPEKLPPDRAKERHHLLIWQRI